MVLGIVTALSATSVLSARPAHAASSNDTPITKRHVDILRGDATEKPHKESDQAVVDGWPLYRTARGQEAFNHAMATLKATDSARPSSEVFKGCKDLKCRLLLPKIGSRGWVPAGRLWLSPSEYVLIVYSPRGAKRGRYRRRSKKQMRIFVFHEFHNSTRNTDLYDTISAHRRSVFVPFYLGKPGTDAQGRRFVVVVQVAPYDVISRHASNHGSRGPGIEVAKNKWEKVAPLQTKAGILVAAIVKAAAPQLRMVRHRNNEGRPMLRAYQRRLSALKRKSDAPKVEFPFVPATRRQVANATGALSAVIMRKGGRAYASASGAIGFGRLLPKFRIPVPRLATKLPAPTAAVAPKPPLTMETLLRRIFSKPFSP